MGFVIFVTHHGVDSFGVGGLLLFGRQGDEDVVFVVGRSGVKIFFGMGFGPFFVGAFDHFDGVFSENFDAVFAEFLGGGEGFVANDFFDFREFFDGAFENIVMFVLHFEGEAFFAEVEGALAQAVFLLAQEIAGELSKAGVIESGRGHGMDGVGLSEDFESGFEVLSAVRAELGEQISGVGDFFGEIIFLVEAAEDTATETDLQAVGSRLGGEFDDFGVGEAEREPMNDFGLVFRRKVGDSVVGAGGFFYQNKWNRWNYGRF